VILVTKRANSAVRPALVSGRDGLDLPREVLAHRRAVSILVISATATPLLGNQNIRVEAALCPPV
jgi:hypothetical protein